MREAKETIIKKEERLKSKVRFRGSSEGVKEREKKIEREASQEWEECKRKTKKEMGLKYEIMVRVEKEGGLGRRLRERVLRLGVMKGLIEKQIGMIEKEYDWLKEWCESSRSSKEGRIRRKYISDWYRVLSIEREMLRNMYSYSE